MWELLKSAEINRIQSKLTTFTPAFPPIGETNITLPVTNLPDIKTPGHGRYMIGQAKMTTPKIEILRAQSKVNVTVPQAGRMPQPPHFGGVNDY